MGDFEAVQLERLAKALVAEGYVMVEIVPVSIREVTDVGSHQENPAAGPENAQDLVENRRHRGFRRQVLEEIGREHDVHLAGPQGGQGVGGAAQDLDAGGRCGSRRGIEIDGDATFRHRVVDELAVPGAEVEQGIVRLDPSGEHPVPEDAPHLILPGAIGFVEPVCVELRQFVGHRFPLPIRRVSRFHDMWMRTARTRIPCSSENTR